MPLVRHADDVTYGRALRWTFSGTEGDWGSMGRYELVRWAELYKKFYLVKGVDV